MAYTFETICQIVPGAFLRMRSLWAQSHHTVPIRYVQHEFGVARLLYLIRQFKTAASYQSLRSDRDVEFTWGIRQHTPTPLDAS